MSALTEIFNYLYAYLIYLVDIFFFDLEINLDFMSPEVREIYSLIDQDLLLFVGEENVDAFLTSISNIHPYLMLSIGIFACGSIIGLVRRLVR